MIRSNIHAAESHAILFCAGAILLAACGDAGTAIVPSPSDIVCDGRDEPVFVVFQQHGVFDMGFLTAGDTIIFDRNCRFRWGSRTGQVTEAELRAFVARVWPTGVVTEGLTLGPGDRVESVYGLAWEGGTIACEWPCGDAWHDSVVATQQMGYTVLWQRFEPAQGPWFAESWLMPDWEPQQNVPYVELARGSAIAEHAVDPRERTVESCYSDATRLTLPEDIAIAEDALDLRADHWEEGWSQSFVAHDPATDRFFLVAVRVGTPWDDDRGVLSWGDLPLLDDCGGLSASGRALAR